MRAPRVVGPPARHISRGPSGRRPRGGDPASTPSWRRNTSPHSVDRAIEALRDQRGLPRLEALIADAVFGWRQIRRHAAVSVVAVVSLGLAIGATASAFRIVDAVLLRPLPVSDPDRLSFLQLSYVDSQGQPDTREDFDYPTYRAYARILEGSADVTVVGMSNPIEAGIGPDRDNERVLRQFVSGNFFGTLGLQPSLGRLIAPADDNAAGAHPVMVLSYDYWARRFHHDPHIVGSVIHLGDQPYDVIGVAPADFIGTEPGLVPDLFVPATMNTDALNANGWSWFTMWVRPKPGIEPEQLRQILQADFDREQRAQLKGFSSDTPRETIDRFLAQRIALRPAGHGVSPIQTHLGTPLIILTAIVVLVLVMACATVGNLLTGLAIARAKEMALRVSIGAGRGRLIQMMFVESAMLALGAFALGALVSWWAPPAVMSMIEPIEIPIRLVFDLDWRLVAFSALLAHLRDGTLRVRARATGLVGVARHRAEGRRRGALAPCRQVAARRADDLLRVRPLRGRPLQDDVRSVVVAAARLLVRPSAGAGRGCTRRSAARGAMDADARDGRAPARGGICGRGGLAAAVGQRLEHHHPSRGELRLKHHVGPERHEARARGAAARQEREIRLHERREKAAVEAQAEMARRE